MLIFKGEGVWGQIWGYSYYGGCCFNFAVLIFNTRAQVTFLIDSMITDICVIAINNKLDWPPTT